MLTFELTPKLDELEIHCDKDGLEKLTSIIFKVLQTGQHEHLKTPNWGGTELSQEKQGKGNILLNHVKVILWNNAI